MKDRELTVLVVGAGGREHALVWALAKSPRVKQVFCTPGNAGIAQVAECKPISPTDLDELARYAQAIGADLTVVGPEAPLTASIRDRFNRLGIPLFGPTAVAARLEDSKIYCKLFLQRNGIPTAPFRWFKKPANAKAYVREHGAPIVVKADGLCGGKGVTVARTVQEAEEAIDALMIRRVHGDAGKRVVLEDCLEGRECSYQVITDGMEALPLAPAQDYKRALDGDAGPNTGGMGSYSPVPHLTPALERQILDTIVRPTIYSIADVGHPYQGVLYFGLMLTADGPQVLEINCRFGDPELQVILPRLDSDLGEILLACESKTLHGVQPAWSERAAVCVVLTSDGYPGMYVVGSQIFGLEEAAATGAFIFHAGTANSRGGFATKGGRVLNVVATGATLEEARRNAYAAVDKIRFQGMYFRSDIAAPTVTA